MVTSRSRASSLTPRTLDNGLRVVRAADLGYPLVALGFRVGYRDETLARRGLTHLVEHLALSGLDAPGYDFNGRVSGATTWFWADADGDAAAEFLSHVVAQLNQLPLGRLDAERQILDAEARQRPSSVWDDLLRFRFGACDWGLAGYSELAAPPPSPTRRASAGSLSTRT